MNQLVASPRSAAVTAASGERTASPTRAAIAMPERPIGAPRNGARALLETLVECGVDTIFGYPGGAALPLYDALHGEPRLRHVLVRHEQAAVHAAEGLRAQHRPRRRGARHLGPGRRQHDHRAARRDQRLGAGAVHQRPGRDRRHRHQRLPGKRCARHVAPGDQVELAGTLARRAAGCGAPGARDRQHRPARTGAARRPEGHPAGAARRQPGAAATAGIAAARGGGAVAAAQQPAARRRPDLDRAPAGAVRRRRADQRRAGRLRGLHSAGAATRRAVHAHPDGPGRLPGIRSALPRHARHARHARGQPGDAPGRPGGVHRRALRRPHHRQARRVLPAGAQDPSRHRSRQHQQGGPGRRAAGRRLRRRAAGAARTARTRGLASAAPGAVVGAHRTLARARLPGLRAARRRDPAAAADGRTAARARRAAMRSSRPTSASTRCGPRSTCASSGPAAG